MFNVAGSELSGDQAWMGEKGVEPSRDEFRQAFRSMLVARLVEDKLASLYRAGKIVGGVYLGRGQEALSAAMGAVLRPGDVFSPLIRDQAARIGFGESLLDIFRTHLGSPLGPMRSRDGNIHRGHPQQGYLTMISHLGSMISAVNGALVAKRFRGLEGVIGLASIGEGGTSTGSFHEGMNQAGVERLPIIVVIANNHYAYSTPNSRQFACRSLMDRAAAYGFEGTEVDGTRLEACLPALFCAASRARSGGGPQMVVANLLRLCGHGEHDDASYVDASLKCSPLGQDPVPAAETWMVAQQWLDAATIQGWRQKISAEIEQTVDQVMQEPKPDPFAMEWTAISTPELREPSSILPS